LRKALFSDNVYKQYQVNRQATVLYIIVICAFVFNEISKVALQYVIKINIIILY